jgi:hypothetical protein
VALGALLLCTVYVWRGDVSSDFWEHAAVVRELSHHPLSPGHPLFSIAATHAYFSPYLLAVALAARVTGAAPMSALAVAGLVNLVLLILALRGFLVRLLPEGEVATPYALVFAFLLWGKDPWMWSGFLHVAMLGYNAPYPSTIAAAAMFASFTLLLEALSHGRVLGYIGIAPLLAFSLTTHPPTAIVLVVGLLALFLGRVNDRLLGNALMLAGAVTAGVAGAMMWPYFPLVQLFIAQPPEFHDWSGVFYQDVPRQIWPAMVALPVLVWRLRRDRRDPLVLFALGLAMLYAVGGLTGKYGLGRVIASIVLLVQIALAAALAAWESRLPARRAWLVPGCTLAVLLVLFEYAKPPLPRLRRFEHPLWYTADSVLRPVHAGEVVLADSRTSYMVPVLTGGHVVAWRHPVYWVPDHAERRAAQDRFFGPAPDAERRAVIDRYRIRWILLNRLEVHLSPQEDARLLALGCVVEARGPLVLLDPRRQCPASSAERAAHAERVGA